MKCEINLHWKYTLELLKTHIAMQCNAYCNILIMYSSFALTSLNSSLLSLKPLNNNAHIHLFRKTPIAAKNVTISKSSLSDDEKAD